jgi:hypothetical protein
VKKLARRIGRASLACWQIRGGRLPRGAMLGIAIVACLVVGRTVHDGRPVNIVDAAIALVTGGLMCRTFLAALFAAREPASNGEQPHGTTTPS